MRHMTKALQRVQRLCLYSVMTQYSLRILYCPLRFGEDGSGISEKRRLDVRSQAFHLHSSLRPLISVFACRPFIHSML